LSPLAQRSHTAHLRVLHVKGEVMWDSSSV